LQQQEAQGQAQAALSDPDEYEAAVGEPTGVGVGGVGVTREDEMDDTGPDKSHRPQQVQPLLASSTSSTLPPLPLHHQDSRRTLLQVVEEDHPVTGGSPPSPSRLPMHEQAMGADLPLTPVRNPRLSVPPRTRLVPMCRRSCLALSCRFELWSG